MIDNSIVKVVNVKDSNVKAKALDVPKFKAIAHNSQFEQAKALDDNLIQEIPTYSDQQDDDDENDYEEDYQLYDDQSE